MTSLKYGILGAALAGVVGCFLPIYPNADVTLWALRSAEPIEVVCTLGSFAVALLVMLASVLRPPIVRWQVIVALCAFAFVAMRLRSGLVDLVAHGAIGGKLIAIASLVGAVFAALSVTRTEATR